MMDFHDKLKSAEEDEIIEGLYELGASRITLVDPELLATLVRLAGHSEDDIRLEVAAAAGVRLRASLMFDVLFQRLTKEERSESVLRVLMDGTTAIALHEREKIDRLSRVLASFVLRSDLADDTRGTAYLCLAKMWNKLSVREYATAPSELSRMTWDQKFVEDLAKR